MPGDRSEPPLRRLPGSLMLVLLPIAAVQVIAATAPAIPSPAPGPPSPSLRFDSARAEGNAPHEPFHIYGNTYYVGVGGLSSILITSSGGDILIDGDLPESVPNIVANIRALGFRVGDIKLILNSHDHFDHAGGIAALQRMSGARVAASKLSAQVLEQGHSGPDDPQYGSAPPIAPVRGVQTVHDGETLHVGSLAITARFTAGHTPGGTSWTWKSCEQELCVDIVYADSLTPVSADGFLFSNNKGYPGAVDDFRKSFATLSALPCDILLTPHPGVSDMWPRLERATHGAGPSAWVDTTACRRYAQTASENLGKRLASEAGK